MSDLLDIFGEVEKSVLVPSHPLREKGLPFRQMYLAGLVMSSVAGGDIPEEKKSQVRRIGASLCLSESEIGQVLEMGLKPSKEGLRAVIDLLADYPDKICFLLDLHSMILLDGDVDETEGRILGSFIKMFAFSVPQEKTVRAILKVFAEDSGVDAFNVLSDAFGEEAYRVLAYANIDALKEWHAILLGKVSFQIGEAFSYNPSSPWSAFMAKSTENEKNASLPEYIKNEKAAMQLGSLRWEEITDAKDKEYANQQIESALKKELSCIGNAIESAYLR